MQCPGCALASEHIGARKCRQRHVGFRRARGFSGGAAADGVLRLLVTGHGRFRARLTQIALNHMRLSARDEQLSRIAFVAVPADTLLVSLPISDQPAPI